MKIRTNRLLLGGVAVVMLTPALVLAANGARHAGTVVSVDSKSNTLVVDELGKAGKEEKLRLHVAPNARVVLSERVDQASDPQHTFKDTPIALGDVKPGDFVVVDVTGRGKAATAESVTVTLRPGSAK